MDPGESRERPPRTLLEALAEVPDPRSRHGRRYPLASLLALAVCAMLSGARSLSAIAQWGRDHDPEVVRPLGFVREKMPCVATFHLLFKALDRPAFEGVLGGWLQEQQGAAQAVSVDGKSLRGSSAGAVPGVHLVAAFAHDHGGVLGQEPSGNTGGELEAVRTLLKSLPLHGTVITGDAQFTQRDLAETIVEKGGTISSSSKRTSPA